MNGDRLSDEYSIYCHIPFCKRKCPYCHFYVVADDEEQKDELLLAFEKQLSQQRGNLKGKRLASVYFGGGTPSLFGPHRVERLLSQLPQPTEVTLEANPEEVTDDLMRDYAAAGINRVSIGVQSLDDRLLKILGRTHDSRRATESVHQTFDAGIENISIDLMYDLPDQTLSQWEHTLEEAIRLPIQHLSLYNLTIEPNTAFYRKRMELDRRRPDQVLGATMYEKAMRTLPEAGFEQYEISAFAKPGRQSVHNSGYWTGRPYLGFGPSACGYWEGERYRNVSNLQAYCSVTDPIEERERLDPEAHQRELLIVGLRLCQGVDLAVFEREHGKLPLAVIKDIQKLSAGGLVCIDDQRVVVPKRARIFYDEVATALV